MFHEKTAIQELKITCAQLYKDLKTISVRLSQCDCNNELSVSNWNARKKAISDALPVLLENLGTDAIHLVEDGLLAFNDLTFWLKAEEVMATKFHNGHKLAFHFESAIKLLTQKPETLAPSKINIGEKHISLFRLYHISGDLVTECHKILSNVFSNVSSTRTTKAHAVCAVSAIEQLSASSDIYDCLKNKGLPGLIKRINLAQEIAVLPSKHTRVAINWILREMLSQQMPSPYKHNSLLHSIHQFSEKLALDIVAIQRHFYLKDISWFPRGSATLNAKLSFVVRALPILLAGLGENAKTLQIKGLDAFADKLFWANAECILINDPRCGVTVTLHLAKIISFHFMDSRLVGPITFQAGNLMANLYGLYSVSPEFALECHSVLQSIAKKHPSLDASRSIASRVSRCIEKLATSDRLRELLLKHGLKGVVGHAELFNEACLSIVDNHERLSFGVLIREALPDVFGINNFTSNKEKTLIINKSGWDVDITGVAVLSPTLEVEVISYLDSLCIKKPDNDRDNVPTKIQELRKLSSFLVDLKCGLSQSQINEIKQHGVSAFVNDSVLMRKIMSFRDQASEQKKQKKSTFQNAGTRDRNFKAVTALIDVLKYVTKNENIVKMMLPEFLVFDHTGRVGKHQFMSIESICFSFPQLANDLREIHAISTVNIKLDQVQNISIRGYFRSFISAFNYIKDELNESEIKQLSIHGLAALNENHHSILKRIRKKIRDLTNSNKLEVSSAQMLQIAIDWMLLKKGLAVIKAYPISTTRRDKHKKEDNQKKAYSVEQVHELAFYIDVCLKKSVLTQLQTLCLILARVLLKTGWNITPVMELETDDLMQMDSPIAGASTYFIRLFKRRASYKTQFHKFVLDGQDIGLDEMVSGKQVANALKDLLYLRDNLTYGLRSKLNSDHPFKKRIAIYKINNEVCCLTAESFTNNLNSILQNVGCSVRFTQRRIRKGGMNYVYRQVEKDFNKYKIAGNHSFSVFYENYLEVDTTKAEQTLGRALEIMGDYFHGRPITGDITIVTEMPSNWQKTPNGECASQGYDAEADAYNKQHYKVHKEQAISNPRCAEFNACLWCRHYRTIADAEHVWKLLSYRDFVIADMEASIVDYERMEMQQQYIEILSERVNDIVNALADIDPNAVIQGQNIVKTRGIHPFWQFANSTGKTF